MINKAQSKDQTVRISIWSQLLFMPTDRQFWREEKFDTALGGTPTLIETVKAGG